MEWFDRAATLNPYDSYPRLRYGMCLDLLGERQSGLPAFKIADPVRDEQLSELARGAAERLLREDPALSAPSHRALQRTLTTRYGRALELFRVG